MIGEAGVALVEVLTVLDDRLDVARYTEPESNGLIVGGGDGRRQAQSEEQGDDRRPMRKLGLLMSIA